MTIQIKDYQTRELFKTDSIIQNNSDFTSLHIDFINNDEKQGYRITWVNGLDDPNNSPENVAEREAQKAKRDRDEELKLKAKDKSLSNAERDELVERLAELI